MTLPRGTLRPAAEAVRGTNVDETDAADDDRAQERKEMKVKIPAHHHQILHKLKIIDDKQISTAVTEALERYLEDREIPDVPEEEVPP